ncbi:MAG: AMP-binding protein [Anaerolineae bacterium]|jgi:phenylacetate-CoA ligase|nr:AMP-binding protein [Anaerolineae bacterium]MBT7069560.1 AMP-binding protein [Anaerolineae bacterium]MBT7325856.1 AMP-binding protein [Anaerolineae bacterium]
MDIAKLITHLAENAPGFAERLREAGLAPAQLTSASSLNKLPVIRKDDLADIQAASPPFGGFLACEPGSLKRIYQSPGPIYEPEPRGDDYWRWESAMHATGFSVGDVVLNAFGYHLTPAGAMFEEGLLAAGCAVIPGGIGNQEQQVQAMHTLGVTGYVGLPSYLKALLDKADEMGVTLNVSKAFVTAEYLPPSLREELVSRGVKTVRQGYGTAECGNLGYECDAEDGWHLPDDAIIQVCDINSGQPMPPGENGEVVVTLYNDDYALIRFGTGDLSAVHPEACSCGLDSPRLMGWLGRVGDAVKVRGMFLHPRQLNGLMSRFAEAVRWQARVTRLEHRDQLSLRVVPSPSSDVETLPERLSAEARERIKFRVDVEIVGMEDIAEDAAPIEDLRNWD